MPDLVVLAAGVARRYGSFKPLAPAGPRGEAIIDLTARDALVAGFDRVVFVVRRQTEAALAYHVRRCWPPSLPAVFVCQDADEPIASMVAKGNKPPGTAHAVLTVRSVVSGSFGVVNADDFYGDEPLRLLAAHLSVADEPGASSHALIAFRLRNTVVTDATVTRATCEQDDAGNLAAIVERPVTRQQDGTFVSGTETLTGDELVSVNLWGFRPSFFPYLQRAVEAHFDGMGGDRDAAASGSEATSADEVLLPTIVGTTLRDASAPKVAVVATGAECLGVTHASDLALIQSRIAALVAAGRYPENLWEGVA